MIYFIHAQEVNRVKIGYTDRTVEGRLGTLQTGSPVKLELIGYIEGDLKVEKILHDRFEADRYILEWFDLSHDLRNYINEVIPNPVWNGQTVYKIDGQKELQAKSPSELKKIEEELRGNNVIAQIKNNDFYYRQLQRTLGLI